MKVNIHFKNDRYRFRQPYYSQLSPCRHPNKTNSPIIQTSAKSQAKINYCRLTEINSRYYGLSLMRTPAQGLHSSHYKGSWGQVNTKVTRGLELRLRKTIWWIYEKKKQLRNDLPVIGDLCYAHRTLGSPVDKHCKSVESNDRNVR